MMTRWSFALLLASLVGAFGQQVPTGSLASGQETWKVGDQTIKASIAAVSEDAVTLNLSDGSTRKLSHKRLEESYLQRVADWKTANAAPAGFGKPDDVIQIQTLQGQMRYDLDEIVVAPGANVQLIFQNVDDMHHNLIVCTPDSDSGMDVAKAAWQLGADGFDKQWVPDHPKVLFASRMVNPHSTSHEYFTAPEKAGDYPYICSLPGHAGLMNGRLRVQTRAKDISELTYTLYRGSFERLPDFEKLTPEATDHVPSGAIDLGITKRRNNFALVFDGQLTVPKSGDYGFTLSSDDGSRLEIDGSVVIDHDGVHGRSTKKGKAVLTEGEHPIRVSYFERDGEESLYLGWSGPGFKETPLSVGDKKKSKRQAPSIPLASQNGEAKIYRNFIQGAGNRAIGVGYDGGINLAFDADQMRLALVWIGGFIDAGRHWNGRGQGHQPPLGYGVIAGPEGQPFANLESLLDAWPEAQLRSKGYRFKGYSLIGSQRLPVFNYHFGELAIEDVYTPSGQAANNSASLSRKLTLTGSSQNTLYFRAAAGKDIKPLANGGFRIANAATMTLSSSTGASPILREIDGQWELLAPITLTDGEATIDQQLSYTLPNQ